jgi:hypothetical protein
MGSSPMVLSVLLLSTNAPRDMAGVYVVGEMLLHKARALVGQSVKARDEWIPDAAYEACRRFR